MKRLLAVFGLIMAQATLTLAVAFFSLHMQRGGETSTILTYEGSEYANASDAPIAESELSERIAAQIASGSARIRYGQDEFVFGLSEIDLSLDRTALARDIEESFHKYYANSLLSAFLRPYRVELTPAYSLDNDKLLERLQAIQKFIEREPVAAEIALANGDIIKTPSSEGFFYDIDASLPRVRAAFESQPFRRYALAGPDAESDTREIRRWLPDVSSDDLENVNGIIAEASTPILDESDLEMFIHAAERISVLLTADSMYGSTHLSGGSFSLRKYLSDLFSYDEDGVFVQIPDKVASQVATTLFIAALDAGIDSDRIFRTPVYEDLPYSERGFGTAYETGGADFQFENSLESNIVVIAAVEGGQFVVRIAGDAVGGANE